MEQSDSPKGIVVITGDTGIWYPVHETEATAQIDAGLDDRIKELARPHIAAERDYFDWKYGPQEVPTHLQRVRRVLRRIL